MIDIKDMDPHVLGMMRTLAERGDFACQEGGTNPIRSGSSQHRQALRVRRGRLS